MRLIPDDQGILWDDNIDQIYYPSPASAYRQVCLICGDEMGVAPNQFREFDDHVEVRHGIRFTDGKVERGREPRYGYIVKQRVMH